MGPDRDPGQVSHAGPLEVGAKIWEHLKNPFYDRGSNDKGLASSSLSRSRAWASAIF